VQGDRKPNVMDAACDMSEPPPRRLRSRPRKSRNAKKEFIYLHGITGLCAELVKRRAEKVLPLLLAVHRRMDMKEGETSVAITPAMWKTAGNPSSRARVTILAHLKRMPDLVSLSGGHNLAFRYRIGKGPLWQQIEQAGAGKAQLGEEGRTRTNEGQQLSAAGRVPASDPAAP
jgi:hypothetical protein